MKVTIEIRDDLVADAQREFADDGSNDIEHEILCELVDAVKEATPELKQVYVVEQVETFRVRAYTEAEAVQKLADCEQDHPDIEWTESFRRVV